MLYERLPVNNREEYLEALREYISASKAFTDSKSREENNSNSNQNLITAEYIARYKAPAKG